MTQKVTPEKSELRERESLFETAYPGFGRSFGRSFDWEAPLGSYHYPLHSSLFYSGLGQNKAV